MKNFKTFAVLLLLCCFYFVNAQETLTKDPGYFAEFRKNEQPANVIFTKIAQNEFFDNGNYYVIYKTNEKGEGYYFKIQFDKNRNLTGTSYAKKNSTLSGGTVEKLKSITKDLLKEKSKDEETYRSPEGTDAVCVIAQNRASGCYKKATDEEVLTCSINGILECSL